MPMSLPAGAEERLAELGDPRKAVQRPAAEALAAMLPDSPAVRERVAALLASVDPRMRFAAAWTLARAEGAPADALPVLLEALGAEDGDVRWATARLLVATLGATDALAGVLTPLLRSGEPRQRKMALYCLRDTGRAVPRLGAEIAAALADRDGGVRLAALAATPTLLAATRETAAMMLPSLTADDAGVRRAAAVALGQLGVPDEAVIAGLCWAAAGDDAALARAAGNALNRLGGTAASRRPLRPPQPG